MPPTFSFAPRRRKASALGGRFGRRHANAAAVASPPFSTVHPEPARRIVEDQVIRRVQHHAVGSRYEDLEFRNCTFESCNLGQTGPDPGDRSYVRNVRLIRCTFRHAAIGPVVLEDVVVDRPLLRYGSVQPFLRALAFNRVILRGPVNALVFVVPAEYDLANHKRGDAFRKWNARFYETVEWAIDISEASFSTIEFRPGIPARLIRRDPTTQVVIRRDPALAVDWSDNRLPDPSWNIGIEDFLKSGYADHVLIAARRSPRFDAQLATIARLREMGVADPD